MTERIFVLDKLNEKLGDRSINDVANQTDCMVRIGSQHGVYRQCSIGWHLECSAAEQRGDDCPCMCKCHVDPYFARQRIARLDINDSVYKIDVETGEIMLGWLAPGWIENADERWLSIEPDAIDALHEALIKARNELATGEAG
ncbi:hypothetical protein SEA_BOSSLADY_46 [Arthrobacter phage BossLady]|uniref:Uncharacterized protein n=1 Tax=Arthrobacter phage BossLady TaxID=2603258 RepID=A0A5B8WGB5_9CAUD|nr:hypothetical protein SEA_BOSSLADY_46 [Arthrobacter phage BossLady]